MPGTPNTRSAADAAPHASSGAPAPGDRLAEFVERMPKVEIHVHLEGSILPATMRDLALRHGLDLPVHDDAALAAFYSFRDFAHFVDVYVAACSCLCSADDFARVAYELGAEAARQNCRYVEAHFNPEPNHRKRGVPFRDQLDGMNAGRARALAEFGVELRWIADGVRDAESGPVSVMQTVEWIAGLPATDGVIGLGLGGHEAGGPPRLFVEAFAAAREAGLHVVAHAGETTGPETIWATLDLLGAERIGHGISAARDPALVAHLAERQIPLEVCPVSNLRTRVVAHAADHPFRALDAAGVLVTVNSDDPPMFGTTLTDEYRFLVETFGYGPADLERLCLNGIRASFLPEDAKQRLLGEFAAEFVALRAALDLSDQATSP
jgi:aminodeoxyfutalosine deaminase